MTADQGSIEEIPNWFVARVTVAVALGKRKPATVGGQTVADLEQWIVEALYGATAEEWPSAIVRHAEAGPLS